MSEPTFLELLKSKRVLFDGAMGTLLLSRNLGAQDYEGKEGCCEILNLTRPELIEEIHGDYLEAGADAVETNTFQGSRLKLEEFGLGEKTHEINVAAAKAARKAAVSFSSPDRPRFVVGSIGPTAKLPSSSDPELTVSFSRVREVLSEQAAGLIEGGVDALLLETQQDILETRAGIFGVRDAFKEKGKELPILVHIAIDKNGRMLMGTDVLAACAILEPLGVSGIGLDCSCGPEEMRDFIRVLAENCSLYIGCVPNAGIPENRDGKPYFPLGPEEMAENLTALAEQYSIDIIGGCCGSTPAHIKEIHKRMKDERPRRRTVVRPPSVSSPFKRVLLHQEPKPLIVGERLNLLGSKKTKSLVENGDYQGLLSIACEQESHGCHLLDVCMAGSEEKERMKKIVRFLSQSVETPLMIDSREEEVVQSVLQIYPGRAVVNSVNLEKGEKTLSRALSLVKEYGACAVAMTITESGMAQTAEEKLEAAARMRKIAVEECGLSPGDLLFDCLTFPLSTGEEKYKNSARETLEGIKRIKEELPEAITILGISNISYGLMPEARKLLNSVFLYHAIKYGLDAAIVSASDIIPYQEIPVRERGLCENLIFNSGESPLLDLVAWGTARSTGEDREKKRRREPSLEEAIRSRILDRSTQNLEELLQKALKRMSAQEIINSILMPAMGEVGKRFDSGEMILPFVLQSSEIMSKATGFLERHLKGEKVEKRGKVVLATVFGDVHDIGKNLVKSVFSNSGYTVYDLGKRVPVHDVIGKAEETDADAIGLSALLVSTSNEMRACVRELSRAGMDVPVIVGGAVVSPSFAHRISVLEDGTVYSGGVFYGKDAFHGLEILNGLVRDRESMIEQYRKDVAHQLDSGRVKEDIRGDRKKVAAAKGLTKAPFLGTKFIRDVPFDEVFPYLNLDSLFRARWGAKAKDSPELREKEFLPALEELKVESVKRNIFDLSASYGYFNCEVSGDSLVIERDGGRVTLNFARRSPITGCFLPAEEKDIAVLGVVTIGNHAAELERELTEMGETKKAFYLHGLSAEMAEALADYIQVVIRKELALSEDMGRRFSPGYPSWPDLSEQKKVFAILKPEDEMTITLTEAFQMVPEHSISFLFCPRAKALSK